MTTSRLFQIIGWILVVALLAVAVLLFRHNLATMPAATEIKGSGHAALGQAAPDVRLQSLAGKQIALRRFEGHPLWINFFATWCHPCKIEMPEIQRRFLLHKNEGLVVLGIDEEEEPQAVRAFARQLGLSFPLVIDQGDGTMTYGVSGIPTSVFIDAGGVIRAIHRGQMEPRDMDAALARILMVGHTHTLETPRSIARRSSIGFH